ncbi:hypothetical protein AKJ16_DCAP19366 [Drosera capensis]
MDGHDGDDSKQSMTDMTVFMCIGLKKTACLCSVPTINWACPKSSSADGNFISDSMRVLHFTSLVWLFTWTFVGTCLAAIKVPNYV